VNKVYSFEVSVVGTDWSRVINAHSRGKAKYEYWWDAQDWYPNLSFTALRCRKLGAAQTPDGFKRTAAYRGMPDVRCGQRVQVGDGLGVIVGHNSSANFDVLFDEDSPEYAGLKLNVHPASIKLV